MVVIRCIRLGFELGVQHAAEVTRYRGALDWYGAILFQGHETEGSPPVPLGAFVGLGTVAIRDDTPAGQDNVIHTIFLCVEQRVFVGSATSLFHGIEGYPFDFAAAGNSQGQGEHYD